MMGNNNPVLMQGDCLELLEQVPDNSIDMVCCDLPYGTTNCRWDTTLDLPRLWGNTAV
ncbi:DNA methylase N-4/N-6 domain-containing protein [Burkholderia pseudomallei]|nr:DNA methylase N-4/N-6 domain-containing protein [Burkholderia pseudomallei]CAJ6712416.1 DNA methylase N-4/N-6 domain-containing protein [Burkholderia pseudomallei]